MNAWLNQVVLKVKALLRRKQLDRELEEELAFHLAKSREKRDELGVDQREAGYAAKRQFGNLSCVKERSREMWTFPSFESIWQDMRFSARMLRKSPAFTIVAVLTLTLGIGANSVIFSVVDAILLRPLPYPEPDRLVRIWESSLKLDSPRNVVNPVNFLDWQDQSNSFEAMAAIAAGNLNISVDGRPMALPGLSVSPEFFSILRVPPLLGRTFVPEDGTSGHDHVIILSYSLWRSQFGANPSIVGRKVEVDGLPCTVIGVMPSSFSFPKLKPDLWTPLVLARDKDAERGRYLTVVARLKPGVTLEQSRQEMLRAAAFTAQLRPDFNRNWSANVVPMLEDATLAVSRPLWVLLASVGFLLLIACSNMANLLLMRGTGRMREIAVRSALGAARSRLIQQLLIESLLLSIAGMAAALLFANLGLHGLLAMIPQNNPLPRGEPISIDARVFLFTFLTTLMTAALFGLIPALRLSRVDPQKALAQGTLRSGVGGHLMLRRSFVVVEVALALLLSIGAGLMLRSFVRLVSADPGFSTEHLVTMHIWTSPSRYRDDLKRSQYVEQILAEIRNSPGVEAASSVHFLPLTDKISGSCFASVDQPPPTSADSPVAQFLIVSSDYFRTMGTPVFSGREFDDRDRFDGKLVAIVNQAFVRRFSSNQNVLGRQFNVCWTFIKPVEIVGVVADARQSGPQDNPEPTIFLCNSQAPMYFASIVVRAQGDPRQIMHSAELAIHHVDPDQAISDFQTMDSVFSDSVSSPRLQTVLLLVFAGIALSLAVIGVYGVVSHSVSQRTQEIGIRVALGARSAELARMVLGEALVLSAFAVGIGLGASFVLTRLLKTLLFEISATDPMTLLAASFGVLFVAMASALLPARRAMSVDPMTALRHE